MSSSTSSSLYVLRTHIWCEELQHVLTQLEDNFNSSQVMVLYDGTHAWPSELQQTLGSRLFVTTETMCQAVNELHKNCWYTVESQFVLLWRTLKHRSGCSIPSSPEASGDLKSPYSHI